MRAARAIAAALLLAACRVDVEGAHCTLPGSATECPDGQACGNDLECSARAASCGTSFCKVGATLCDPSARLGTCVADADPVCGSWVVRECGANLACVARGAAHACECVANAGTEFAAGAGGSAVDGAAHPTGLASPPQCRFKRLSDALAAAVAHGGPTTVKVYGDPGTAVVFTGEAFPLVVPQDVTLSGADAPAGETVIHGDAGTGDAMVSLQGTLEHVHLQNVSMTGTAVDVTCSPGPAPPKLREVVVSAGGQKLALGVAVRDCSGVILERVDVSGASVAALDVGVGANATLTVTGSRFHGSGTGVRATGGTLVFDVDPVDSVATSVSQNGGVGVLLTGTAAPIDATFNGVRVFGNDGTGLVVDRIQASSKLKLASCTIQTNGRASPTQYGPANSHRLVGGVLVSQTGLAAFQLQATDVWGNDGGIGADEVAFESSGSWSLSGGSTSCTGVNRIAAFTVDLAGCHPSPGAAVFATGGAVDAQFVAFYPVPPGVSANVNALNYCVWNPGCP